MFLISNSDRPSRIAAPRRLIPILVWLTALMIVAACGGSTIQETPAAIQAVSPTPPPTAIPTASPIPPTPEPPTPQPTATPLTRPTETPATATPQPSPTPIALQVGETLDSDTPVEVIIAQTRASEWKDRWDAVNLIGLDLIEEGMDALIERALIDDNPHPRWRSLWAIATIDSTGAPAIDDFVAALDDPDVIVSGNAAIALAFFDHDAAREPLIAMMDDPDDYRRWEATFSLRNVPGEGVVEVISAHIDYQNEPNVRVRQESALALGDLQDLTTIGALVEALGADPSPEVRWRAALALKRLGDESVIADLRNALESEDDPQVLEQITETIEALGG